MCVRLFLIIIYSAFLSIQLNASEDIEKKFIDLFQKRGYINDTSRNASPFIVQAIHWLTQNEQKVNKYNKSEKYRFYVNLSKAYASGIKWVPDINDQKRNKYIFLGEEAARKALSYNKQGLDALYWNGVMQAKNLRLMVDKEIVVDVFKKQLQRTISTFKKIIKLDPTFSKAYHQLGKLYLDYPIRSKDNPLAYKYLLKAVELDAQNSIYHYDLGRFYLKNGIRKKAKEHFRLCLSLQEREIIDYKPITKSYKEKAEKLIVYNNL